MSQNIVKKLYFLKFSVCFFAFIAVSLLCAFSTPKFKILFDYADTTPNSSTVPIKVTILKTWGESERVAIKLSLTRGIKKTDNIIERGENNNVEEFEVLKKNGSLKDSEYLFYDTFNLKKEIIYIFIIEKDISDSQNNAALSIKIVDVDSENRPDLSTRASSELYFKITDSFIDISKSTPQITNAPNTTNVRPGGPIYETPVKSTLDTNAKVTDPFDPPKIITPENEDDRLAFLQKNEDLKNPEIKAPIKEQGTFNTTNTTPTDEENPTLSEQYYSYALGLFVFGVFVLSLVVGAIILKKTFTLK